ncbi:MAG: hypothetical protein JXB29_11805 [Sedimentisphaerales bacterium]|nr:hypothetical protein [Sedimentisphaerales bacterium]
MIRLTRREHWLLVGFAILVALWLSFIFAVRPAIERTETLKRVIPEKQAVLQQLRIKSAQYLAMQDRLHYLKKQAVFEEKGFELIPFLESMFKDSGLIKKITMMKQDVLKLDSDYFEITAEIELENLTIKQLVNILLKTRSSSRFLLVKSFYTQRNASNPNLLDAIIHISTLKSNLQ